MLLRDKPHHLAPPPCCFWPEVLFDLRLACFSWWQKWLRALSASQDGRGVQGKTRRPAALLGWSGTSDLGGQPAAPATGQRGPRSAGWAPGSQESLTGLRGFRAGPGRRPCRQAHGGKAQGVVGCQEPHFPLVPALPVGREDSGEGRLCAQWWLRPSVGSGASSATQGGTQCHGRPGGGGRTVDVACASRPRCVFSWPEHLPLSLTPHDSLLVPTSVACLCPVQRVSWVARPAPCTVASARPSLLMGRWVS